jgi:hypothetical protein
MRTNHKQETKGHVDTQAERLATRWNLSYIALVESQGRGSGHVHMLIWLTNMLTHEDMVALE